MRTKTFRVTAALAVCAVFIYLVPLERVSSGETFAAQAGEALFGPTGGQVFSAVVIFAVLGSLAVIIMSAPRDGGAARVVPD